MSTNVVHNKSGVVDFSPYCREIVVPTDQDKIRKLTDIHLTFFCKPTVSPLTDSQRFLGPVDIRLYINEYDVTEYLRELLAEEIRALPPVLVRTQYLKGVEKYLAFVQSYADPPPVTDDLDTATQYANMTDWGDAFQTLGLPDRTPQNALGWGGNLHAVNYIYQFIPILPISLGDVWDSFASDTGGNLPESLADFEQLVITTSQGPAPSIETIDTGLIPGGQLHYRLSYGFLNPLAPRLRNIAMELRQLSLTVLALQENYLDELTAGLHTVESNFTAHTAATTTALEELKDTVDNIAEP